MSAPMTFRWTGDGFTPERRFAKVCDAKFVVGETYQLDVAQPRSLSTHNHYFAAMTEAWRNLPEVIAADYPTVDHLRKRALIACGFAQHRQFVAGSKAEAVRLAAFMRPMDEYAVIRVSECAVSVWTAQSQSMAAMGRKTFQESKDATMAWAAGLCGVNTEALIKNAREAA